MLVATRDYPFLRTDAGVGYFSRLILGEKTWQLRYRAVESFSTGATNVSRGGRLVEPGPGQVRICVVACWCMSHGLRYG